MSTLIEPSGPTAPGQSSPGAAGRAAKPLGAKWGGGLLAAFAGTIAFLTALAWPMLAWWHWEYTRPESYYGHAIFVPFLTALMLWHRRNTLRAVSKKPCPAALWVLVPALALLVLAVKTEMQAVMSSAFLLVIASGVWYLFGTQVARVAAFPLAFLWLMAPLPGPVLNDATLNMQLLSTVGAAKLLHLAGFNPVHQGNIIRLENYTLNVDVPCSGFKLLLRLLTFNAAFSYLADTTRVKRLALFLFSLPLSLAINSLRIALIGVVGECVGVTAAHTFHDVSGILTLILCLVILFWFAKGLGCRTFAGQPIF